MNKFLFSTFEPFSAEMTSTLLGGKGAGLMALHADGINVPPAYVISTEMCNQYMERPEAVIEQITKEVLPVVIKGLTDKFGYMPLVSVRSGAPVSMPGMMDTILNAGLDSETFPFWEAKLGKDCAFNSYERLVEMYGNVVHNIERTKFEGLSLPARLDLFKKETNNAFPHAAQQLIGAVEAVFKSWNNDRAKAYRKLNNIPDTLGTAVTIQAMVFGNMGKKSCTGVLFTRDPSTGENKVVGEYLVNAQGEDVVAGIRTPDPLDTMTKWNKKVAAELMTVVKGIENVRKDAQDVEFTVQEGELFILQTRNAMRSAQAAVRIAIEMKNEGMVTVKEMLNKVTLKQVLASVRPVIDPAYKKKNPAHGVGIPASNGCATGVAVFSSVDAINCKEPCILITEETTPNDIGGMNAAVGILTATGGMTSHAAVVGRGMNKVCVVGCTDLELEGDGATLTNPKTNEYIDINAGDLVTIDGATGEVWVGDHVPVVGGTGIELVGQLISAIESDMGLYRTCTSPEQMHGADKLLVATYEIDRPVVVNGDKASAVAMKINFEKLVLEIAGRDAVIDLRLYSQMVREADCPIEYLLGYVATAPTLLNGKVNWLCALVNANKTVLANTKVLGLGLSGEHQAQLKAAGLEIIPTVATLSDLTMVNGICIPDYTTLLYKLTEEEVKNIVALKKKAGDKITSFNIVTMVESGYPEGSLYAMAGMQSLQCLLKQVA